MNNELKLYQEFKTLISQVGEIKMAWFTTFVFNLPFFEKYILSALVGTSPFELRNIKDYEALNDRIVNSENSPVDVKVFYDFRAMPPEIKRTSVQTIGVNPNNFNSTFKGGVFHPKVALFINNKNEMWIMTGSANLTLAAWSKNSECILIKKVEDKVNAQSISDFFIKLLSTQEEKDKIVQLNATWQEGLKAKSNWRFVHSLSNMKLLDHLLTDNSSELTAWSPYFSRDFNTIISHRLSNISSLTVIPDLTPSGSIRIEHEVLELALSNEKLSFMRDLHNYPDSTLVHAKVWATPETLAIGSWNFTSPGLNISPSSNNIEAGIVHTMDSNTYRHLIDSCELHPLTSAKGMKLEELEGEKDELLNDWKINCRLYADWSEFKYWIESEDDIESKPYFVALPGKSNRISIKELLKPRVSFFDEHKIVLKNRLFTVYNKKEGGDKVFVGLIIELNPVERPPIGFDSMNDLLRAWSDKKPENKSQYHELNYTSDLETGEEISEQITQALKGDYSNAWFTMFLAFEQIKYRLDEAKDDQRELEMIGYKIPGSIQQISEHLNNIKQLIETNKTEMSAPFIWFMINEGNGVIQYFNDIYQNKKPRIKKVENINLKFEGVNQQRMKKWLKFIKKSCDY